MSVLYESGLPHYVGSIEAYMGSAPSSSASWSNYAPTRDDHRRAKTLANGGRREGDGARMEIRETTYYKGLGVHAPSEVVIATNGAYDRFSAWVGVDDTRVARKGGSVSFEVEGDGKILTQTGVLTYKDPAYWIDVDVSGVQTLTLRVTDGGDGRKDDHANWADARLYLSPHTDP